MADPHLDRMLGFLASRLPEADALVFRSGTESCTGLFDDGEVFATDTNEGQVQTTDTVIRYREGAITLPAVDAAVTVQKGTSAAVTYYVREALKDPANPGMIRVVLSRS